MLEIRHEIDLLKADKNYDALAYLAQFNSRFREKVINAYPDAKDSVLQKVKVAKFKRAKCVKCHAVYGSDESPEEMGMCGMCHAKLTQECLGLSYLDEFNIKKGGSRKYFPHCLGKEKIAAIQQYYCDGLGVKFKMKKDAPNFIRKEFGLDITDREIMAAIDANALKRAGIVYNHCRVKNERL